MVVCVGVGVAGVVVELDVGVVVGVDGVIVGIDDGFIGGITFKGINRSLIKVGLT